MTGDAITLIPSSPIEALPGRGFGFRLWPVGRNADFPRIVELDGRPQQVTSPDWFPTDARRIRVLPAAAVSPQPYDSNEDWLVYHALSQGELKSGPSLGNHQFMQTVSNGDSIPTANPTLATQGYPVQASWVALRLKFKSVGAGDVFQKWVYTAVDGTWSPAGQYTTVAAGTEEVEDEYVIGPDDRFLVTCNNAGRTLVMRATKRF
jgi:hypothetical protein